MEDEDVVGIGTTTLHSLKAQYTWKIKNINDVIRLYRRPIQSNPLKLHQKSTGQSWDWWLYLENCIYTSVMTVQIFLKPLSPNGHPNMTAFYKLCVGNPDQPQKHYKTNGSFELNKNLHEIRAMNVTSADLLMFMEEFEDSKKGILRIVVDLEIIGPLVNGLHTVEFPELFKQSSPPNNSNAKYNNRSSSDVTIKCDNRVFHTHKLILDQSSVFSAMLNSQMKEGLTRKIIISDVDASVLELLIKSLYGVSIEMPSEQNQLMQLLDSAEKYDLQKLKWACLKKMRSILSDDNAAEFTIAVCKYSGNEVIRNSFRSYCLRRINILLQNNNFKQLYKDNLDNFIVSVSSKDSSLNK